MRRFLLTTPVFVLLSLTPINHPYEYGDSMVKETHYTFSPDQTINYEYTYEIVSELHRNKMRLEYLKNLNN